MAFYCSSETEQAPRAARVRKSEGRRIGRNEGRRKGSPVAWLLEGKGWLRTSKKRSRRGAGSLVEFWRGGGR